MTEGAVECYGSLMGGPSAGVRAAVLGALVCACGGTTVETHRSARGDSKDDPSSGGSSSAGAATDGAAGGGAWLGYGQPGTGDHDLVRRNGEPETGGAIDGATARASCDVVDGQLSYGPIGEPWTLPPTRADDIFGFRTPAGHVLAWRTYYDPREPSPNLFVANLDADFRGEARALAADTSASALDVVPVPGGFITAICRDESQPEWLALDDALVEFLSSPLRAPDAPCDPALPAVLWTGEVYLVSFTDERGFVVACLDEQGAVVGEEVLHPRVGEATPSRFSKNGDRVLLVFEDKDVGGPVFVVFDSHGMRLTDLQAFGTESSGVQDIAIAPSDDGWLVATDNWGGDYGVVLRVTSRDGTVAREEPLFGRYVFLLDVAPSVYGGALLIAHWDSGGQFGGTVTRLAKLDEAGEVERSEERSSGLTPVGFVIDPDRDLVIERSADQVVVQEYGCLE